jgi:hypothetical protein
LDILWPFGTFSVYLVHFFRFGIMHQEKSGPPVASYLKETVSSLHRSCRSNKSTDRISTFHLDNTWHGNRRSTTLHSVIKISTKNRTYHRQLFFLSIQNFSVPSKGSIFEAPGIFSLKRCRTPKT